MSSIQERFIEKANACYDIAEIYRLLGMGVTANAPDATFAKIIPFLSADDTKFYIIRKFDAALTEVSTLPTLDDLHISEMLVQIRSFRSAFLKATAGATLQAFLSAARGPDVMREMKTIGHTVLSLGVSPFQPLDRVAFVDTIQAMLQQVLAADEMPEIQRAVLALELKSMHRIMTDCQGLSEEDVRRSVKNIIADIDVELHRLDKAHTSTLEKIRSGLAATLKGGDKAIGLMGNAMNVAALAGGLYAVSLPSPDPVKMIEGPKQEQAE